MNIPNYRSQPPATSSNPFYRSLQIFFWILFRPSVWYAKVQNLRHNISPNFCLAELSATEWRNPVSRKLLLPPLLIWPFFIFLASALKNSLFFPFPNAEQNLIAAFSGACIAFSTSVLMSFCISFNGGLIYGIFTGLASIFIPVSSPTFYLAFGFCAGVAGSTMRSHLLIYPPIQLTIRKITAVVFWGALIAAFVLTGVLIAYEFFFDNQLNVNQFTQKPLSITMLFSIVSFVGVSFLMIIAPRSGRPVKVLASSSIIAAVAILLTIGMHDNSTDNNLLFAIFSNLNRGVLYTLLFGLAFSIIYATGWNRPAIALGALCAGSMWVPVAFFTFKGFSYDLTLFALTPLAVYIGLTLHAWRPLLFFLPLSLWNLALYLLDEHRLPQKDSLLRYHPAFWDELNYLQWPNFSQHLILLADHDLSTARQAMLMLTFGRQRHAVFQAHIELAARDMEKVAHIQEVNKMISSMEDAPMVSPISHIMRRLVKIANDTEIAENQSTAINTRTSLAVIREQVIDLERNIRFSQEPLATRLLPVTIHWQKLLTIRLDELAQIAENTKAIQNPYVFGVPINQNSGIFVGRANIFDQIEELLLAPLRPPLFLYGQRRMGKTSLLLNLTRILPSTILPMFIDCQGLGGTKTYAELFYRMVKLMARFARQQYSLEIPRLSIEKLPLDSAFLAFSQWLDQVEDLLEEKKQTGLIIFDEFVTLDEIFWDASLLPDDFLMLLRHIVQHRRNFRVLISGSHSLVEMQKWAAYLVNMQTIKLSYLQEQEARQLIETPIANFPLAYQPDTLNKILEFTRGHPALIQILCYELVDYKNKQPLEKRYLATPEDVEAIIPAALNYGAFYFEDIKSQLPINALNLLSVLAKKGCRGWIDENTWRKAYPDQFELNLKILLDRDLIEYTSENNYRFQVELVRRWVEFSEQNLTWVR